MSNVKICVNCKWHDDDLCKAPQNMTEISPVDGVTKTAKRFNFCTSHRNPPLNGWLACRVINTCGAEGRWFESNERQQ